MDEVVVLEGRRSRIEIMKECFAEEVRSMPQRVLEMWVAQHHRLARRNPSAQWRCQVLETEYKERRRAIPYRCVG